MVLRKVGCDAGDWIDLAQDRDQWWAYIRPVLNLRVPKKLIIILLIIIIIIIIINK